MSVDAGAGGRSWTTADTIAGLLATVSIFTSALGLVWRPVRLVPFAVILARIAARMSARQQHLAGIAVAVAVVCWTVGMTIAVVTENPLY
jgi:Co/Zn/Cd efflux system component